MKFPIIFVPFLTPCSYILIFPPYFLIAGEDTVSTIGMSFLIQLPLFMYLLIISVLALPLSFYFKNKLKIFQVKFLYYLFPVAVVCVFLSVTYALSGNMLKGLPLTFLSSAILSAISFSTFSQVSDEYE